MATLLPENGTPEVQPSEAPSQQQALRSESSLATPPTAETDTEQGGSDDPLLELCPDFEYFRSGPMDDLYVSIQDDGHRETWPIEMVSRIMTLRFFKKYRRGPKPNALNTALATVQASCFSGPRIDVHVRFARSKDAIYLDLCDEKWRAVEITKEGWRIVSEPPVRFRRPSGAKALPDPTRGGSLTALRQLLNTGSGDQLWILLAAWMVGAFLPEGAFAHLALEGEQGSAKSTTARLLLELLDPSEVGLSGPPKSEDDATLAAMHHGLLGFDNLSTCNLALSDMFCRFSTGQGMKKRTLYTTLGLTVVKIKVPVLLNGINSVIFRGDLQERTIMLTLPPISPEKRRTDKEIRAEFERVRPGCLGALLDAVVVGLQNLQSIHIPDLPRMADFCQWVAACEPALPWAKGTFLSAYRSMLRDSQCMILENDQVAVAVVEYVRRRVQPGDKPLDMTARDLLGELDRITAGRAKDVRQWPTSPEKLGRQLTRIAPLLRSAAGIEAIKVASDKRHPWRFARLKQEEDLALFSAELYEPIGEANPLAPAAVVADVERLRAVFKHKQEGPPF